MTQEGRGAASGLPEPLVRGVLVLSASELMGRRLSGRVRAAGFVPSPVSDVRETVARLQDPSVPGTVVTDLSLMSPAGQHLMHRTRDLGRPTVIVAMLDHATAAPQPRGFDPAQILTVQRDAAPDVLAARLSDALACAPPKTGGSHTPSPVLVVADGETARHIRHAEGGTTEVHRCETLAQAQDALQQHRYELIVCGLAALQPSGFCLIRDLRRAAPDSALLVVGEAHADPSVCERLLELGVQECVASLDLRRATDAARCGHAVLRQKRENRLRRSATHDPLTGLVNAREFRERLEARASQAGRHSTGFAVMMIDLDGFKAANDRHGHAAGDFVLKWVADALREVVRKADTAARLGGDEFGLIFEEIYDRGEAAGLAKRIVAEIGAPVRLPDGATLRVSASLGIALCPEVSVDADPLLKAADRAMFEAKAAGQGLFGFAGTERALIGMPRARMVKELRGAVANRRLSLEFQPQLDMRSSSVTGLEALLRWRGQNVGPEAFVPLLEELGLIVEVGQWVLNGACLHAKRWLLQGKKTRVAVNVSPLQLHDDAFPEHVAQALARHDLAPDALELEVTETVLLQDLDRVVDNMKRIRSTGVRLVLDDFGAGYASFNYLSQFCFDGLKLDRTLIANLSTGERARKLVQGIIELAHVLELTVVAEGVETFEQAAVLRGMGCDACQGYLYGKPHFVTLAPPTRTPSSRLRPATEVLREGGYAQGLALPPMPDLAWTLPSHDPHLGDSSK